MRYAIEHLCHLLNARRRPKIARAIGGGYERMPETQRGSVGRMS